MFSTITMALSTRKPIEKIRAKSDTRLILYPMNMEENTVITSTTGMVRKTTMAGLKPMNHQTNATTTAVAKTSLNSRAFTLSLAVLP